MTNSLQSILTFLFTDIEGGTRLWNEHPTAMPAAMARHNAIIQQAVSANRGRIFQRPTEQLCAVFSAPADALCAAAPRLKLLVSSREPLHLGEREYTVPPLLLPAAHRIDGAWAANAFKHLDTNGDGLITRDEFSQINAEFFFGDDEHAPGNWLWGSY